MMVKKFIESTKPIEIRKASPEFESGLARYFDALVGVGDDRTFHPHELSAEGAKEIANYQGNDLYYLLVTGSEVVGYGMLRGWEEGYEVPSIGASIHTNAQGFGLGRLLMSFLHVAARQRGAKKIRAKVYKHNKTSIKMLKALGYSFEDYGNEYFCYLDI